MIELNNLTPEEQQELLEAILGEVIVPTPQSSLEFRVYYDEAGHVITYTSEDLPGNYLVITPEEYQIARHDAIVVDGILVYTHTKRHVYKLTRNNTGPVRTSKYDISILSNEPDDHYYQVKTHEIKR